jgi:hypothetical protein
MGTAKVCSTMPTAREPGWRKMCTRKVEKIKAAAAEAEAGASCVREKTER